MSNQSTTPAPRSLDPGVEFSGLIASMLNVISRPVSVKPGGYADEIFLDLSANEKEQYACGICFLVVREPRECPNQHLFCSSCILTWSMSLLSDCRSKCPVCRTEGRYRPNPDKESALSKKHVKCPEKACSWAGQLLDYKWHSRRHVKPEAEAPRSLPPRMRLRSRSEQWMTAEELGSGMEEFSERLDSRRRNIAEHYRQQEQTRRSSLNEVEALSRRLGTVAQDIVELLDNMQTDSRRFQNMVDETEAVLPAVTLTPRNNENNNHVTPSPRRVSPRNTGLRESPRSSIDRARVEQLLSEGETPGSNPFADRLPALRPPRRTSLTQLPEVYSPREADQRVERIMNDVTPTENPFTLPNDLPVLRPPRRTRNGLIMSSSFDYAPVDVRNNNTSQRRDTVPNSAGSSNSSRQRNSPRRASDFGVFPQSFDTYKRGNLPR